MAEPMDIEAGTTSPNGVDEQDSELAGNLTHSGAHIVNHALNPVCHVAGAEKHGHSSPSSTRTSDFQPQSHPHPQASPAEGAGPSRSEGGGSWPPPAPNELLTEEALISRIIKVCVHDGIGPVKSGDLVIVTGVTLEFCVHAKAAARRVKEQRRASIAMAPERPDLPMDEIQLMGFLAGDIFGRELLQGEARQIGQAVDDRWRADAAKKAARKEREKAERKKVKKKDNSVQLLWELEQRVARERAEQLATACDIKLPPIRSVIVDAAPPPPPPPPPPADPDAEEMVMSRSRPAVSRAPAGGQHSLDAAMQRARRRELASALGCAKADAEWAEQRAEWAHEEVARVAAKYETPRYACDPDCDLKVRTKREALRGPREEAERRERAAKEAWVAVGVAETALYDSEAGQRAELEQLDAEDAQRRVESEQALVELEESLERSRALDDRIAESDAAMQQIMGDLRRLECAETRKSLHAHAEHAWGSVQGSNTEPKVFSLVGKSVEEIRAMSSEVSQHVTSAEEHAALTKLVKNNALRRYP